MKTEAEIRRAFYLLGAVLDLSESSTIHPLPEDKAMLLKHGHSLLAWILSLSGSKFDLFIDSIESQLAAFDLQIVEVAGGARIMPLRNNHRKRTKKR